MSGISGTCVGTGVGAPSPSGYSLIKACVINFYPSVPDNAALEPGNVSLVFMTLRFLICISKEHP